MTKRQFAGILTLIIVCLTVGVLAGARIAAAKSRDGGAQQASPSASPSQGPAAQRWEYRFVRGIPGERGGRDIEKAANQLGAEGFELVTFTRDNNDVWLTCAFRRRR